ncbi:hypothetical protein ACQVQY_25430 [Bacillus mycoides]|uniref:hypothetical protein n=1 Tax=Bacillus mycoides TaxID=1405 RepID=UPI003D653B92
MTTCLMDELRNYGVNLGHLKQMEQEKPILYKELEMYYDCIGAEKKDMLVEISKIKGLTETRLNPNCTWTQHITGEAGVLALNRIEKHHIYLQKNGLSALIEYFQQPKHKITLNYFDKEDIYVVADGNHRTVFAKMINAPYMFAEVVPWKYNHTSHQYYLHHKKLLKDLKISAERLNFTIQNGKLMYNDIPLNTYDIPFYSRFNFPQTEMISIKRRFTDIQNQLSFLEVKMRLFYFSSKKWKIRICKTMSHMDNNIDTQLLYGSLVQLYEDGYVYK